VETQPDAILPDALVTNVKAGNYGLQRFEANDAPYLGDDVAAIGRRSIQTLLVTKRRAGPRGAIIVEQQGRCAKCGC
jgi:hypothetical protein